MNKYVKVAACLGALLALPIATFATPVNIAVVDANGTPVNNAEVSFEGASKGVASLSGLWTADAPFGKTTILVNHPSTGTVAKDVYITGDDYFIAHIVDGIVRMRAVSMTEYPGPTIAGLGNGGDAVNIPGPDAVQEYRANTTGGGSIVNTAAGTCGAIDVTQNTDPDTIDTAAGVACPSGAQGYARMFDLSVGATAGAPHLLKCVEFAIQGGSAATADVNVYAGDNFPTRNNPADLIATVAVPVNGEGFYLADFSALNVVLPADSVIVVEHYYVNYPGDIFPGANALGQSAPSYIVADVCGGDAGVSWEDLALAGPGFPDAHLLFTLELDPAGPVNGACCDDATPGCVDDVLSTDCTGRFAANTLCADLDPACGNLGACCNEDGSCSDDVFEGACTAAGGTYQGDASDCAGVTCPQPPDGACCAGDGTCTVANEFTCAGNFQGATTVCDPNPCPQNFNCTSGVGGQLPDQLGHGAAGTVGGTSDANPDAGFAVADNFTALADGTINSVCWWGLYIDFAGPTDCGPGTGDAFTITYHADDAGGDIPGSVIAGPFATTVQATPTGLDVATGIGPVVEYGYEATHDPVAVSADTCYWIQIQNNTTATCFWLWSTAPAGDDRGAQDDGGWAATDYDQAFALDIAFDSSACTVPDPCEGAVGDCCAGNGSTGCDNPACCAEVCAQSSFCCDTEWDASCAAIADGIAACGCNPPDNDACADATAVTVPSLTAGSTLAATVDNMADCGTTNTAPGVWYTVTGTGNMITATTCELQSPPGSADYDTKIGIFCQGCDVPLCVDGNDDETGCDLHSTIQWCSQAGVEYAILVHGFLELVGNFELSVFDDGAACTGAIECTPPDPTGACCHTDTTCSIETEADCAAADSNWLGEDALCFDLSGTPSVYTSSPDTLIPDDDLMGFSDTVNVGDSFTIADLKVELNIVHTFKGDLIVQLEHGGTTIDLVNQPGDATDVPGDPFGCSEDNYTGTVIDDNGAGGAVEDACFAEMTSPPNYTPNMALSVFKGLDVAGDWTLTVADTAALDTGTFVSWSLIADTGETACAECGNDIVETGEECDGGDCCAADCTFATGVCRDAVDGCDVAESCSGSSADCPADGYASASTVCRPAAGDCDAADNCDGSGGCDADAKLDSVCRASTGSCDPLEACDGANNDCPADVTIDECADDDGCCLEGLCNANNDTDCVPVCGNGVQEGDEECDDGNANDEDSCTSQCESRQPVPTVSQWGLVVLALLILAAAKVYFNRRQATA